MSDHLVLRVDRFTKTASIRSLEGDDDSEKAVVASAASSVTHPASSTHVVEVEDLHEASGGEEEPLLQTVECRICQEEDSIKNLETPCNCSGSLKGLHGEGTQIEAMRNEIVSIDAEIARLQARRASLVEDVAHEDERLREQAMTALMKKEEESRKFSLLKTYASRMEVKESVRRQALVDLRLALDTLEECKFES